MSPELLHEDDGSGSKAAPIYDPRATDVWAAGMHALQREVGTPGYRDEGVLFSLCFIVTFKSSGQGVRLSGIVQSEWFSTPSEQWGTRPVRLITSKPGLVLVRLPGLAAGSAHRPGCGGAGVMAVVMLLGAFPFDHARQHEGAVDDEALDLWCALDLALQSAANCIATVSNACTCYTSQHSRAI